MKNLIIIILSIFVFSCNKNNQIPDPVVPQPSPCAGLDSTKSVEIFVKSSYPLYQGSSPNGGGRTVYFDSVGILHDTIQWNKTWCWFKPTDTIHVNIKGRIYLQSDGGGFQLYLGNNNSNIPHTMEIIDTKNFNGFVDVNLNDYTILPNQKIQLFGSSYANITVNQGSYLRIETCK
jgi:hypothetical protein